jgi:predicted deacylase
VLVPGGVDCGDVALPLLLARGRRDGPRVVVLGGVHGDEYEGIAAAGAVWRAIDTQALRGLLVVVPVANPPAYRAGSRATPIDGGNLARTFPGRPDGTLTECMAYALSAQVIRGADCLIDLHSAGQHYAMPLLCGSYAAATALGRRCEAAALAFGAPVYWAHPALAPGRSLAVALEAGIPCLYAECSGGGRIRAHELQAYCRGVRRVLAHLGALPPSPPAPAPRLRLRSAGNVDEALPATQAGLLVSRVRLLERVRQGQELGTVVDERGAVREVVRAPQDGIVILARRTARVRPGDGLFLLAAEDTDHALPPAVPPLAAPPA